MMAWREAGNGKAFFLHQEERIVAVVGRRGLPAEGPWHWVMWLCDGAEPFLSPPFPTPEEAMADGGVVYAELQKARAS